MVVELGFELRVTEAPPWTLVLLTATWFSLALRAARSKEAAPAGAAGVVVEFFWE